MYIQLKDLINRETIDALNYEKHKMSTIPCFRNSKISANTDKIEQSSANGDCFSIVKSIL